VLVAMLASLLVWTIVLAVLVFAAAAVAYFATRKPTEEQVRRKVRKLYQSYKRRHPDEPEFKVLLGVLTARHPTMDWESRRQMTHHAGDLERLIEVIVAFEFQNKPHQHVPSGFGTQPPA
jgi:hypothetical protein